MGFPWDPSIPGDSVGMQFQVRKAVSGAAAAAFELEMPREGSVNDLMEALAWDPGSSKLKLETKGIFTENP